MVLARERWGRSVFVSGFARRRGSNIGESGEHRAIRCQKLLACTPGTLTRPWLESAFFASFLCRFGQMTCRHAQWLIVIKNTANSRRPLSPKAPPWHQLRTTSAKTSKNRPPVRAPNKPQVRTPLPRRMICCIRSDSQRRNHDRPRLQANRTHRVVDPIKR
jgi:hypothetical protein